MDTLTNPSQEVISGVLQQVDYRQCMRGCLVHERIGAVPIALYSFEEVCALLHTADLRIGFADLEQWIRHIIGDAELADRIRGIASGSHCERDKLLQIRELMGRRLVQCYGSAGNT